MRASFLARFQRSRWRSRWSAIAKMSGPSNDHMGRRQRSLGLSEAQLRKRLNQIWRQMKRQWRVLCFSEVPSNILRWSHYAHYHEGVVFAFEPRGGVRSPLLAARAVHYSKKVNTAASLGDFVLFLTSQCPKPSNSEAFEKSVFCKSEDWSYEKEWRSSRRMPGQKQSCS